MTERQEELGWKNVWISAGGGKDECVSVGDSNVKRIDKKDYGNLSYW